MFSEGGFEFGGEQVFAFAIFIAIAIVFEFDFFFDVASFFEVFFEVVDGVFGGEDVVFFVERIEPIERFIEVARGMCDELFKNFKHPIEGLDVFGYVFADDKPFALIEIDPFHCLCEGNKILLV
jgi:hypothetical protein